MLTTSTDLEQPAAVHSHAVHHNLVNTIGSLYVDDGSMPCVYIANNYDEEEVRGGVDSCSGHAASRPS
jgi:hypothetical protein